MAIVCMTPLSSDDAPSPEAKATNSCPAARSARWQLSSSYESSQTSAAAHCATRSHHCRAAGVLAGGCAGAAASAEAAEQQATE